MSRHGLRKGEAHRRLVARVMQMRAMCGIGNADLILRIAAIYDVPIGLIMSRRELNLR